MTYNEIPESQFEFRNSKGPYSEFEELILNFMKDYNFTEVGEANKLLNLFFGTLI